MLTYPNIRSTRADRSNHAQNESTQERLTTYQPREFSRKERPPSDTFTGLPSDGKTAILDRCKSFPHNRKKLDCLCNGEKGNHFCPSCGTELAQPSTPLTEPFDQELSSASSSHSRHHGRFLPGTILARRYRIVGLLGRGGMGEVHRADDLKLGQAVALKLLPERLANDPKRLEYFHNEVRLTAKWLVQSVFSRAR